MKKKRVIDLYSSQVNPDHFPLKLSSAIAKGLRLVWHLSVFCEIAKMYHYGRIAQYREVDIDFSPPF